MTRYPTLTFIPSSGGWTAEMGGTTASAASREAALCELHGKLGTYAGRTLADTDCHLCFGEGHHEIGASVSPYLTTRMGYDALARPILIECAACFGTGESPDAQIIRDLRGDHDSPYSYEKSS